MIKQYFLTLIALLVININISQADKVTITKQDRYFDSDIIFYDNLQKKRFIEDYEGTNVLIVFWATWCGTCIDELPKLDNLQKDFRKLPFKIIAISEDEQDADTMKKYFDKYEIKYLDIFYDYNHQLLRELGIAGLPTAYFLDSNGKVKIEFKGKVKWEDDQIRSLLISQMNETYELPKNSFKPRKFFEEVYNQPKNQPEESNLKTNEQTNENNEKSNK